MEIFLDPHIWAGLLTLVILEIVLGIDNLVFIAILADKLPPHQRDKARILGLSLALLMRLALLASISWIMSLEVSLFTVMDHPFTGRDLILLAGGFFLLFKATSEIHERIEGSGHSHKNNVARASFGLVVAQIIVLDAVFSLDAVITAVGMVEHIEVMMLAVCIAMSLMIFASKPLTNFVIAHPTVIMLCLGFLLLVGFSLVAEGFGFHVPKGYLYAAIGFSILIEAFNQTSTINRRRKAVNSGDLRQKTADAVLRILSGKSSGSTAADDVGALVHHASANGGIFSPEEQDMIQGVLQMTERPIRTIMTPRHELVWLDLNDSPDKILIDIRSSSHGVILACQGSIDEVIGVLRKADLVNEMTETGKVPNIRESLRKPLIVHENLSILKTLDMFKKSPMHMAVILDEYGSIEGIVTLTDIVEMIAGNLPEHENDHLPEITRVGQDRFIMDAMVSIYDLGEKLGRSDFPEGDFTTLAGFLLHIFERLPNKGDSITWGGWVFTVQGMDKNRIDTVLVARAPEATAS